MKNLFLGMCICGLFVAACRSNSASSGGDTAGNPARPDTNSAMSTAGPSGKADTPGKSNGAGTGPAHGNGPDHVDTVIHDSSSVHKVGKGM